MRVSVGCCGRPAGVGLLFRHIRLHLVAGPPLLHHFRMGVPVCRSGRQVGTNVQGCINECAFRAASHDANVIVQYMLYSIKPIVQNIHLTLLSVRIITQT